ncbi:hypothetical protein AB0B30_35700 [Streptomyces narbonensis]|uniref:Zinc-binding dehydrogenase n=1 Tax=Streptomyces narbonensis TaxID=67333 RepID=A0ABV3CM18_9ACTN
MLLAVAGLGGTVRVRGDVVAGPTPERVEDFEFLLRLASKGAITVVIDQLHPLQDITEARHRDDNGRKVGNIVVLPYPSARSARTAPARRPESET